MNAYEKARQVLGFIRDAKNYEERRAILAKNRDAVLTTSASVIVTSGEADLEADNVIERLRPIRLAQAVRAPRLGKPDGFSNTAGGLAKRLDATRLEPEKVEEERIIAEFFKLNSSRPVLRRADFEKVDTTALPPKVAEALLATFDDLVRAEDGSIQVTNDIAFMTTKNLHREVREEIGVEAYATLKPYLGHAVNFFPPGSIRSDEFILNPNMWRDIYDTGGIVYAVDPLHYRMSLPACEYQAFIEANRKAMGDGETQGLQDVSLVDALLRVPFTEAARQANPGEHYRYFDESLTALKIAADALQGDPAAFRDLIMALSDEYAARGNPVDFPAMAKALWVSDVQKLDEILGLPAGTLADIQNRIDGARPRMASAKLVARGPAL